MFMRAWKQNDFPQAGTLVKKRRMSKVGDGSHAGDRKQYRNRYHEIEFE